ncbi:MAG: hypothetical protein CMJ89_17480 [Planctomycetes bacterium]|jgi:hypothetical protein|nr:hypothetical protein [Planctomycetota bacterium]
MLVPLTLVIALAAGTDRSSKLAGTYADAIEKVNATHARKPEDRIEADLGEELPRKARSAFEALLELDSGDELTDSLARAAEAALELDLVADFDATRARLAELDADAARALGLAHSRERFQLRGLGGLDADYLTHFGDVLDAILESYDEVFGFDEFSKVPGKKLRVRVTLVDAITRPPRFEPQHAFHSLVDFPVVDGETFRSPTSKGQFLQYGLCHELGHVIAMWGHRTFEEDYHAWAHYTGVVIVDHLAERAVPAHAGAKDVRWRSSANVGEGLGDTAPSTEDRNGVLALLFALHDSVGPKAIGDAIDYLDAKDKRLRINHVRYYTFRELRDGLLEVVDDKALKKRVSELLPK